MATYHRSLQEISLGDLPTCGGKAARLGEALRLGCPVPPGVVLTTELFSRFMLQGGLQGEVVSILSGMQPTTMHQFQAAEVRGGKGQLPDLHAVYPFDLQGNRDQVPDLKRAFRLHPPGGADLRPFRQEKGRREETVFQ